MKKIYVGNLSYKATEDDVRDIFAEFGAIEQVALIRDRATNQPKGFGFVTFETAEAAQAAVSAKNGQELLGRSMKVSIAKEKSESEGGGGRRGGGGGRGGFGGGGRGGFGGNAGGGRSGW